MRGVTHQVLVSGHAPELGGSSRCLRVVTKHVFGFWSNTEKTTIK